VRRRAIPEGDGAIAAAVVQFAEEFDLISRATQGTKGACVMPPARRFDLLLPLTFR